MKEPDPKGIDEAIKTWPRHWQEYNLREALTKAILTYLRVAPPNGQSEAAADDIRAMGWAVAVHNDYRLNSESYTFWLFTKDGQAIKGEGKTDADALNQVRFTLAKHSKRKM